MNEKVRSRVQAAEMAFFRKFSGLTLLYKVKSADICESLTIESLFLRLEKSQLRWYGRICDTNVPGKSSQKTALFNTDCSRAGVANLFKWWVKSEVVIRKKKSVGHGCNDFNERFVLEELKKGLRFHSMER